MARDVFISYAHLDGAVADRLRALLEENGLSCWIAPRDIVPGMTWADAIVEALQQSKIVVLVFSRHANESRQMARELDQADREGVPVVLLRIEEVEPARRIAYYLGNTQWLDVYKGSLADHEGRILVAIRTLVQPDKRRASCPVTFVAATSKRG
jgi:hypothetical protein